MAQLLTGLKLVQVHVIGLDDENRAELQNGRSESGKNYRQRLGTHRGRATKDQMSAF